MDGKLTCCLCGQEFDGMGNSPWPVEDDQTARCCDECNWSAVIPARMKMMERN